MHLWRIACLTRPKQFGIGLTHLTHSKWFDTKPICMLEQNLKQNWLDADWTWDQPSHLEQTTRPNSGGTLRLLTPSTARKLMLKYKRSPCCTYGTCIHGAFLYATWITVYSLMLCTKVWSMSFPGLFLLVAFESTVHQMNSTTFRAYVFQFWTGKW